MFATFAAMQGSRGCYEPKYLFNSAKQMRTVSVTWVLAFVLLLVAAFAFKLTSQYSRGATFTFFFAGWTVLISSRLALTWYLKRTLSKSAFTTKQVLMIADRSQINVTAAIRDLAQCGYSPLKVIELPESPQGVAQKQILPAADLIDFIELTRKTEVDSVILQISWSKRRTIDHIMNQLRVLSIPVYLLPDSDVAYFLHHRVVPAGLGWTAELKRAPLSTYEQIVKRIIDLVLSSMVLVLLAPLMVMVCILIKLDSRGPAFFRQTRHGFNGRPFKILKFRTMRVLEDGDSVRQATKDDPRITDVGRMLRRANIDELPQLFNVLLGNMSLVGPRPHAAAHNNEYEKLIANYSFRYHMRPGITGWAQIQGLRGETKALEKMVARVDADLWYINNWSMWLDLKILLRTLILGIQPSAY